MPQVSPLTLTGATLNAEDAYSTGVFNPDNNDTLEILNGGMAAGNITGTNEAVEPWAMQLGAFAQGYYYGFDRMEFIYGYQCSNDQDTSPDGGSGKQRVPHAALSTKVFIPFTPKAVMYGFQAWFQHDDTKWLSGAPREGNERFDWRFKIQSMTGIYENPSKVLHGRLTWGRLFTPPGTVPFMPEDQWQYVHKSGMIVDSSLSKGYFSIEFSMSGALHPTQSADQKCKTVAGGVWILALR